MTGYDDPDDNELLAEARAQRRRSRQYQHWCETCLGHVGPDSPCYEGDDGREPDMEPSDDAAA